MRWNISVFNIVKNMSKQKQFKKDFKAASLEKRRAGRYCKNWNDHVYSVGFFGWIRLWSHFHVRDVPMFLNPFYMYLPGIEINRIQRSESENIGQCGQWSGSLTNFYLNFIILSKNHFEIYAPYVNRSLIGKPFYLFRQH